MESTSTLVRQALADLPCVMIGGRKTYLLDERELVRLVDDLMRGFTKVVQRHGRKEVTTSAN